MKKITLILATTLIALLFSACGGDGEGNFETDSTSHINIVNCDTNSSTIIKTNDLLVKDDSNTTVKIIDDANGTKTICAVTGSAHLVREN